MKRTASVILLVALGTILLAMVVCGGCAPKTFKVHGPGGCTGEIKQDPNCDPAIPHFPDGMEVHCHSFVMTDQGPVARETIVVYHCIKAKL